MNPTNSHPETDPSTSPEELTKLASSSCPFTRTRVAGNPSTPSEVLRKLACDPEASVTFAALLNPNCPENIDFSGIDGSATVRQ
jgi:hypothetical protein